ncbi:hypothetical protein HDE70_002086 [Pedobacter cryoconitis]|nr:hypothetical protein [Pedobacter cryoconitis]
MTNIQNSKIINLNSESFFQCHLSQFEWSELNQNKSFIKPLVFKDLDN